MQEHTYIWEVPERAGPGKNDPSSVMWMYHSHADETKDTWAGLMGAMIFTGRWVVLPRVRPCRRWHMSASVAWPRLRCCIYVLMRC